MSSQTQQVDQGKHDIFVSYASEDGDFARPLADALQAEGLHIWRYDLELKLGDNPRQSIEEGIRHSRYGLVILSPAFYQRPQAMHEKDLMLSRDIDEGQYILAVLYGITEREIRERSLHLANRWWLDSARLSKEELASQIARKVRETS